MARAFAPLRVERLSAEPQLASLAILESAADVAVVALAAEYPELASDHDLTNYERELPELRSAIDVIELARALVVTITRYKRDIAARHERDRRQSDLLPF